MEKAFKDSPPVLVDPRIVAQADGMLSEVEQKAGSGDTGAGFKLLAKIPSAAKLDAPFASRFSKVATKLEESADRMLADVQAQIKQGTYVEAVGRLKELSAGLSGLPAGVRATAM